MATFRYSKVGSQITVQKDSGTTPGFPYHELVNIFDGGNYVSVIFTNSNYSFNIDPSVDTVILAGVTIAPGSQTASQLATTLQGSSVFLKPSSGGGGGNVPSGTDRQVVGYNSSGTPTAVTLGWKQLSDMPSIPSFPNGVLIGTAFQPDGDALFAFGELNSATFGADRVPFYGTNGRLKVGDAVSTDEAVSKGQLDRLDYRLATNYMIVKSGANTVATPRFNSGLPTITNTNSALVFQQAVNAIQTGLGGKIVFDGDFTFTDHVTITGFDGQFDPRVQVTIEGLGYQSRITQNTAGKNIFIFKNKISAIIRNMYLVVGVNGASAIVGDDTGTSPSFGEISIYEGVIENVKVQHSGTQAAVWLKNYFNLQVSHLDAISTTNHGILLQGSSVTGQNYGNSHFSFVHANGGSAVGMAGIALISDVASHPINFNVFSSCYVGSGYYGLYLRGASSNTFAAVDIEYMARPIKIEGGGAGVESGNNKFLSGYLYVNPGGTAIDLAEKTSGNYFRCYVQCDDATPTIVNDLQQFRAGNEFDLITGFSGGANPIINIASPSTTKLTLKKEFDGLVRMAGPYVTPDLTALAQNVKPSTGNTRDLGDASNFWANIYAQSVRPNFIISRSADLALSTNSSGSGIEFSLNNTATKVGKFQGSTGELSLGGLTAQAGSQLTVNSTTRYAIPYPRMTNTQKTALTNLVAGATVYVSDATATDGSTGVVQVYNGTVWKNMW